MASGIDLKPLSDDLISQMGYDPQDLWMVKIGSIVFGPYETESLKHYVHDNEHLFEEALASRGSEKEWIPFWVHTKFSRRKPQVTASKAHPGPFWLMDLGVKVGPFNNQEIDKKIEMGLLLMTDHISMDDGQSWVKIYQVEGFNRRTYSADELPIAPFESSFENAKLKLLGKIDQPRTNSSEEIAEMCWSAQQIASVIPFKIDDIPLQSARQVHVSQAARWFFPGAMGVVLIFATSAYFILNEDDKDDRIVLDSDSGSPFDQRKNPIHSSPSGQMPDPAFGRHPASTSYSNAPVVFEKPSYSTHVETHEEYGEPAAEPDPIEGPVSDVEQQPAPVHSLVDNNSAAPQEQPQEQSLDQAMNGAAPEQPVVEEASDF
jgi:hypothetical protein